MKTKTIEVSDTEAEVLKTILSIIGQDSTLASDFREATGFNEAEFDAALDRIFHKLKS